MRLSLLSCFAVATLATAEQVAEQDQLLELSFDELLDITVSVATKSQQSLFDAPSTITVFTKRQIENLALENVHDLLNLVPGFQVTRGDWVAAVPKEHARGVYLDNGYVLFMVDGERLNELSFGKASVYAPFIPLSLVKRVEIIRGPGSALYGSNAFMGVVNIITEKEADWISAGLGQKGSKKFNAGLNAEVAGLNISLLFDWRQSDGNTYLFPDNEVNDPYKHYFGQMTLSYAGLEFTTRVNNSLLEDFVNLGGASLDNFYRTHNESYSLNYQFWSDENSRLDASVHRIRHEIESGGKVIDARDVDFILNDFVTGPYWVTEETEWSLEYFHNYDVFEFATGISIRSSEQTQAGTVTNYLDTVSGEIIPADSFYLGTVESLRTQGANARSALLSSQDTSGAFAQLKWKVKPDLSIYAGVRYDDVDGIGENLSPRFAVLYNLSERQNIKLQYGEAFRTPVTNELYSEDPVTVGNPNLQPEEISTLELVWTYQDSEQQFQWVVFANELEGFVNKVPLSGSSSQFTFVNLIDKDISGTEISGRMKVGDATEWYADYTKIFNEPFNPSYRQFANLGIDHQWNNLTFGLQGIWRDSLSVPDEFYSGSYWIWNAKFTFEFNKALYLSFSSTNVFDKHFKVYEPRLSDNSMPGRQRESWVNVQYRF